MPTSILTGHREELRLQELLGLEPSHYPWFQPTTVKANFWDHSQMQSLCYNSDFVNLTKLCSFLLCHYYYYLLMFFECVRDGCAHYQLLPVSFPLCGDLQFSYLAPKVLLNRGGAQSHQSCMLSASICRSTFVYFTPCSQCLFCFDQPVLWMKGKAFWQPENTSRHLLPSESAPCGNLLVPN